MTAVIAFLKLPQTENLAFLLQVIVCVLPFSAQIRKNSFMLMRDTLADIYNTMIMQDYVFSINS